MVGMGPLVHHADPVSWPQFASHGFLDRSAWQASHIGLASYVMKARVSLLTRTGTWSAFVSGIRQCHEMGKKDDGDPETWQCQVRYNVC